MKFKDIFEKSTVKRLSVLPSSSDPSLKNNGPDVFWRSAGHQMKTSLNLIAYRMQELLEDPDPQKKEEIQEEMQHLSSLLSGALSFSRSGQMSQDIAPPQSIDFGKALQRIIQKALPAKDQSRVQIHIPKEIIIAEINEASFSEAFRAVLENALSYSQGHSVEINLTIEKKKILLSIKNEGSFLAPSQSKDIFKPFFRGDSDLPGTGLGLSIAQRIIEQHNGQIEAKSDGAHWTEFVFTLPLISLVK